MKYNGCYESVQSCAPVGTQQKINGNCNSNISNSNTNSNFSSPLPVNVNLNKNDYKRNKDEISNPVILFNDNNNKKSVTRKLCTCPGGMAPCPSHTGTERSLINGYTNSSTHTSIKNDRTKTTRSKINLIKPKTLLQDKILPAQCCEQMVEHHNLKNEDVFEKNDLDEENLSTSRTFTIESNDCLLNIPDKPVNTTEDLRLSLASLISNDAVTTIEEKQTSKIFQKWLGVKIQQEREIRQREAYLKKLLEMEKQRKLEMDRENFAHWLNAKKQKDLEKKALQKMALEEEQRRKHEKKKREEMNKKQYKLWLKLKDEQELVKKMNEQKRKVEKEETERRRLETNKCAFQEWLISSKDKPKPVPLNRGLESLRTSTSISFVNPVPWVPNIQQKPKSTSK